MPSAHVGGGVAYIQLSAIQRLYSCGVSLNGENGSCGSNVGVNGVWRLA